MTSSSSIQAFLAALHRGGAYHYLWRLDGKRSTWAPVSEPLPDMTDQADVYFGVHTCLCIPPMNADGEPSAPSAVRGQVAYIDVINCLFADFDAKDYTTRGDPDPDRAMARIIQYLDRIEPAPTAIVPSGGGFHAYWILSEPWLLVSHAERQQASSIQARWCDLVGGDHGAHDLARVLRVPGTLNGKYDPPRRVGPMEYFPERTYVLADLVKLLPAPTERSTPTPTPRSNGDVLGGEYWLDKYKDEALAGLTSRHKAAVNMALQLRADDYAIDEAAVFVAQFSEFCETLGPCQEPAIVNLGAALKWAYSRPDFDWEPAGAGAPIGTVIVRGPHDDPIAVPNTLEELLGVDVPPLPESCQLDPALGADVCHWLDEYTALSSAWSPRAYVDFHTACALWLLSAVAARRVVVHLGGPRYPNLYIALVARTSLWAKSTTAKIVNQTLHDAGLSFLLAPDDSTPQRFISDLVQKVPADWDQLDPAAKRQAEARLAFPAARGWFYEEMGQKLDAMLAPAGFMADFRGILRKFDDCPESYQYASIGRGLDAVKMPYIAMLGNMTPSDLQRATRKSPGLWQDGFWARWAFVTPPGDCNSSRARFPEGQRDIPLSLVDPIRQWHERLGVPNVELEPRRDADGKSTSSYDVFSDPQKRAHVLVDSDASDAFYAYHDGMLDVVEKLENKDFDGNYARFAEKALRVAMLIASLENDDRITLAVWARAQSITERWRRSLHKLYAQANEPPPNEKQQQEEKATEIVRRLGQPTANEVARYVSGVSGGEMVFILDGLAAAGALIKVAETQRGRFRYALAP